MIEIYKYNPRSIWFKEAVNNGKLKGKKRDIAIENAIKENGVQISIVEYLKDWNRNDWGKDYCYACYGETENSIERFVNAERNGDGCLNYWNVKNDCPEDLIESRTSWDEMKGYADGLYWFINSLISDVVTGKIIISKTTWKPSDEQMDALHYVTNFDYGGHKATLVSLYEQLKKLKE